MVKNILVLLALLLVNTSAIAGDKDFYIKALMGGNNSL